MPSTRLAELSRAECLTLMASQGIGRAVYTVGALPVCVPVTFALVGSAVVFRTSPDSELASAVDDAVIAFEVDDFDTLDHTGWSVLVTGTASVVRDVATAVRLDQTALVPWAGERTCWVRLVTTLVSGRRVRGAPFTT